MPFRLFRKLLNLRRWKEGSGIDDIPASFENLTINGNGNAINNTKIMAADGNTLDYNGLTIKNVVFNDSNVVITGWRAGNPVSLKNLVFEGNTFSNIVRTSNEAAIHLNTDTPVDGLTVTGNTFDGISGASNSGVYTTCVDGNVVENNTFKNIAFRPFILQIANNNGTADAVTVIGNTFSDSPVGRLQILGTDEAGEDAVSLTVTNNIIHEVENSQELCFWNLNEAVTTMDLFRNYYGADIENTTGNIYINSSLASNEELVEMGFFPYYSELLADGTIDTDSLVTGEKYAAAMIGDDSYMSVKDALDAAKTEGLSDVEVKILADVNLTEDADGSALAAALSKFDKVTLTGDGTQTISFPRAAYKYHAIGAVIEFNNLIIDRSNAIYNGIAHNGGQVYNNCVINGVCFVHSTASAEFHNCTFNVTGDNYNVWTYGAETITFNSCKFYSDGKSVLVYKEGSTDAAQYEASKVYTANINDCEFYAGAAAEGKAAIEIDSSLNPYAVNVNASSAIGFDNGSVSGDILWNVKKQFAGELTNNTNSLTVNGVTVDLDALKDDIGANKPVINVEFEKVAEDDEMSDLYNINITSDSDINRLNSVDLTFDFEGVSVSDGDMTYEIIAVENISVTTNTAFADRYMFSYNGKDGVVDTGVKLTVAQVKITGYGEYDLSVKAADTNAVHATTLANNIVDIYVSEGAVEGEGVLDISAGITGAVINVPTRKLTVSITFPNAVAYQTADYQKMTVTIVGGNVDETIVLGEDAEAYEFEKDLPYNTTYAVTVSGAGYRTARYSVRLNENKKLNFWNNVMDNALEVEEGDANSAKTVTFLAGDIVADNNINVYDLSAVVSYFGEINLTDSEDTYAYAKYDLNRDGKIDSKDVAYVLVSWGE